VIQSRAGLLMANDGNTANGGQGRKLNQLIITLDIERLAVNVGGFTENMDIALAMLDMAKRALEGRLRAEEVRNSLAMPLPGTIDIRGRR